MTLFMHEWKRNGKSLLIWSLCVGLLCMGCLFLYESVADPMAEMAGAFSEMGAFSMALGMDKVSLSTLEGFYAIEIAIMMSLGGAMFAAMTGAAIVAKEEEGHTSEFLNTLPIGRTRILLEKYFTMVTLIFAFQLICIGLIFIGFAGMGSYPDRKCFLLYHGACFLMQLEIGSIAFLMSAVLKKKPVGAALGLSVFLYMVDLMCRVVSALENAKYITPYYFSNATDIFSEGEINPVMAGISLGVTVITLILSVVIYKKRDLAA